MLISLNATFHYILKSFIRDVSISWNLNWRAKIILLAKIIWADSIIYTHFKLSIALVIFIFLLVFFIEVFVFFFTLQGIVYQLDVALQSLETQRAGLVFIYDMSDSKYSNFDFDLSQKILMLLKVRISKVFFFFFQ